MKTKIKSLPLKEYWVFDNNPIKPNLIKKVRAKNGKHAVLSAFKSIYKKSLWRLDNDSIYLYGIRTKPGITRYTINHLELIGSCRFLVIYKKSTLIKFKIVSELDWLYYKYIQRPRVIIFQKIRFQKALIKKKIFDWIKIYEGSAK
jgi:hypothetical protein